MAHRANVRTMDEEPPPIDIKHNTDGNQMGKRVRNVLVSPSVNQNRADSTPKGMLSST